jgi:hypothetical protein
MKEQKSISVGLRISEKQREAIQKIIDEGKAKTISTAIKYLINLYMIKGA